MIGARVMLPGHLMASKGDRVAMHSSVEARYPFLDEDVLQFLVGRRRLPRNDVAEALGGRNDGEALVAVLVEQHVESPSGGRLQSRWRVIGLGG